MTASCSSVGKSVSGKDQAWYCREAMRSCFAAEPGLLVFLDGIAKRMAQGR